MQRSDGTTGFTIDHDGNNWDTIFASSFTSDGSDIFFDTAGSIRQFSIRNSGNHKFDSLLNVATGNEIGLELAVTVNKATSDLCNDRIEL